MKKITFIFTFLVILCSQNLFSQNALIQKLTEIRIAHFSDYGYNHSLPLGTTGYKKFYTAEIGKFSTSGHNYLTWITPILDIDNVIYDDLQLITNKLNTMNLSDIAGISYINDYLAVVMYASRGNFGIIRIYTKTFIQANPQYLQSCQYQF